MRLLLGLAASLLLSTSSLADDFAGHWAGAYDCDEITRTIQIELLPSGANLLSGMVTFSSESTLGRYAVRGVTSPDGRVLVVEPSGWVDRPDGFAMVGFKARLDGTTLFGTMSSEQCGAMYAVKKDSPVLVGQ